MAHMYPEHLLDFVESSAEQLLYKLFEAQLPNSFIVMHSVKWLMRIADTTTRMVRSIF